MPGKGGSAKSWTDTEKTGLLFQIIAKMKQPIPWHELDLPEGRTLKAVQVMVDKEKTKVKQFAAAAGSDEVDGRDSVVTTPVSSKKRAGPQNSPDSDDDLDMIGPSARKKIRATPSKRGTPGKGKKGDAAVSSRKADPPPTPNAAEAALDSDSMTLG